MKETSPVKRRLTAILAADAVGYSARMGEDEDSEEDGPRPGKTGKTQGVTTHC